MARQTVDVLAQSEAPVVVPSGSWFSSPRTPQRRQHRRTTSGRGERARIGAAGRCAEMTRAVPPDMVGQTSALRPS